MEKELAEILENIMDRLDYLEDKEAESNLCAKNENNFGYCAHCIESSNAPIDETEAKKEEKCPIDWNKTLLDFYEDDASLGLTLNECTLVINFFKRQITKQIN